MDLAPVDAPLSDESLDSGRLEVLLPGAARHAIRFLSVVRDRTAHLGISLFPEEDRVAGSIYLQGAFADIEPRSSTRLLVTAEPQGSDLRVGWRVEDHSAARAGAHFLRRTSAPREREAANLRKAIEAFHSEVFALTVRQLQEATEGLARPGVPRDVGARFQVELEARGPRRPDVRRLHADFLATSSTDRDLSKVVALETDRIDQFLAVTFQSAGEEYQTLLGLLGIRDTPEPLDALAQAMTEVGLIHWREPWPYLGIPVSNTTVVTDGDSAIGLIVDAEGLEKISLSMRPDVDPNFYLLYMLAPAGSEKSQELYPSIEGGVSDRKLVDAMGGAFGSNLFVSTLTDHPLVDILTVTVHSQSLQSKYDSFLQRIESRLAGMAEHEPTGKEIVDSVTEQVRRISDPLARIVLVDELSRDLPAGVYEEGFRAAAEFVDGDGTWTQIGAALGITRQAAQQRFNPELRAANAERFRRRRADPAKE